MCKKFNESKITFPGDKSIAHRALIISALSSGVTKLENFPLNKDCLSTLNALKQLGIRFKQEKSTVSKGVTNITVIGKGLLGLTEPKSPIFLGDSGTTFRLLLGVLAGQSFRTKLTAGASLSQRPMLRVTKPLRLMGAVIKSKVKKSLPAVGEEKSKIEEYPPITIRGGNLRSITYKMPVASAQVKSAIILAGLFTKGETKVIEPIKTRNHTECMLSLFKARLKLTRNTIVITGNKSLVSPGRIFIPGDISSAGFFIVLTAISADSQILLRKLCLNPSRLGLVRVLRRMGAFINIKNQNLKIKNCEPMGDILVKSSSLKGTIVRREEIPSLIDELPILMVAASVAKGKTLLEGVGELRVKETDRIRAMTENLKAMGVKIRVIKTANSDKIIIEGSKPLRGARVRSFGDHRTAMSMVIAGSVAAGETNIDDVSCIDKSFPGFFSFLDSLKK